jgi:hypothetical protein
VRTLGSKHGAGLFRTNRNSTKMKFFLSPPATAEAQQFYTRYAPLVPKLKLPGYLSQIVSGLTEWGILYALIFSSLAVFWPSYAAPAGIVGASVGVAIIEGGLRGLLPFSARAIIKKRWRGLDGWISAIVLSLTVLLLAGSGYLSFAGSRTLVESIAAPPAAETTTATDSLATSEADLVNSTWEADVAAIRTAYDVRLDAVNMAAAATLRRMDAALATLRTKEQTTGQRFTTARDEVRHQIADAKADRDTERAKLTTAREAELAALRTGYRGRLDNLTTARDSTRHQVATANASALHNHQDKVGAYGGGLAWFTVLCLIILIVSITVEELHRAGAGIEELAEPDAYTFEGSALAAFREAITARFRRLIFGLVHHIERGTPEAPEPVAAPIIWQRADLLNVASSQAGITRKLKPLRLMKGTEAAPAEPERRMAGFTRPEPSETTTAAPRALYSPPKNHENHENQQQRKNHETPEMREAKQRLKRYKKRLGEHAQKAKVQQRNGGEVKTRTVEAIDNNQEWVKHYEGILNALTNEK